MEQRISNLDRFTSAFFATLNENKFSLTPEQQRRAFVALATLQHRYRKASRFEQIRNGELLANNFTFRLMT